MSNINRRMMMTGAGTAAGALIVGAATAALKIDEARAAQSGTTLSDLLAEHATCKASEVEACDRLEATRERFDATPPPIAPLEILPNGECWSGHWDCRKVTEDLIRKEIRTVHQSYLDRYCGAFAQAMLPSEVVAETKAAIAKSQRRAMRRLTTILRAEKQLEDDLGLTAAIANYDAAVDAVDRAAIAVHAYRPTSPQEHQTKAEWLRSEGSDNLYNFTVDELEALFSSLGERA